MREFHGNIWSSSLIRVYFLVRSQKRATTKGLSGPPTLTPARTQQRRRQWTEFCYNFVFETFTDLCGDTPDFDIDMLTAVGLTPGGSSTVHIYTQTIHRTIQLLWKECGPCPVFASYTLAFTLQLRKKHGKTSVRVAKSASWHSANRTYIIIRTHKHYNKNT